MRIRPYKTLDERTRLRAKSVTDGVWPPPDGPGHLATQQSDVYFCRSIFLRCVDVSVGAKLNQSSEVRSQ
jgi:hypothetical protein